MAGASKDSGREGRPEGGRQLPAIGDGSESGPDRRRGSTEVDPRAQALRANLRRRKDQARGRRPGADGDSHDRKQ